MAFHNPLLPHVLPFWALRLGRLVASIPQQYGHLTHLEMALPSTHGPHVRNTNGIEPPTSIPNPLHHGRVLPPHHHPYHRLTTPIFPATQASP